MAIGVKAKASVLLGPAARVAESQRLVFRGLGDGSDSELDLFADVGRIGACRIDIDSMAVASVNDCSSGL